MEVQRDGMQNYRRKKGFDVIRLLVLKAIALRLHKRRGGMIEEHGPDNPRDWNPNHPLLKSRYAPHESGAVIRAHRAGFSGLWICQTFRMTPPALMGQMRKELTDENDAARKGVSIYAGRVRGGIR